MFSLKYMIYMMIARVFFLVQAAFAQAAHVPRLASPTLLPPAVAALTRLGWQPDSEARACAACAAPFTDAVRRHHCRLSGRVVCARCSTKRAALGWVEGGRPCRVADHCYAALCAAEAAFGGAPDARRAQGAAAGAAQPAAQPSAAAEPAAAAAAGPSSHRPPLAGAGPVGATAARQPPPQHAAAAASAGSAAADAKSGLQERGRQLEHLADRTAAMHSEAEALYHYARRVRLESEARAGGAAGAAKQAGARRGGAGGRPGGDGSAAGSDGSSAGRWPFG